MKPGKTVFELCGGAAKCTGRTPCNAELRVESRGLSVLSSGLILRLGFGWIRT